MKNYGLKFEKPVKGKDYELGAFSSVPKEVLKPDGQWDIPEFEHQASIFETQNCVAFGTTSILEMLLAEKYDEEKNFSDRYVGIIANTDPYGGNTPHKVIQAIRHFGLIPEEKLPYTSSLEEYYKPKPPTEFLDEGKKFLKNYTIKHEFVSTDKIKEALQYSPVGISVYAWTQKDGIYYKPEGARDNHWVVCYGYSDKGWMIFDSYDDYTKIYSFDADISIAKRYWIERKPVEKKLIKAPKCGIMKVVKYWWWEIFR